MPSLNNLGLVDSGYEVRWPVYRNNCLYLIGSYILFLLSVLLFLGVVYHAENKEPARDNVTWALSLDEFTETRECYKRVLGYIIVGSFTMAGVVNHSEIMEDMIKV